MPEAELLVRKTEALPPALFTEKLAEAEHEASKPNAKWLNEHEFWNEND